MFVNELLPLTNERFVCAKVKSPYVCAVCPFTVTLGEGHKRVESALAKEKCRQEKLFGN
jgi:hypothetical protein